MVNHTTPIDSLRTSTIDLKTTNDHQKRKESPLQQSKRLKRAIIHHLMKKIRRALLFLAAPRQ